MNSSPGVIKVAVSCLCVMLLLLGEVAAQRVIRHVGDLAAVGSVTRVMSYGVYYWSLAFFLVLVCWLLLCPRRSLALAVVPPALGVLPEGTVPLMASCGVAPATETSIVRAIEMIEAPAFMLLRIIAGYEPDRFATGLSDPPTRITLLGFSTVGYLNGLLYLGVTWAVLSTVTRCRSRDRER